MINNKSKKQKIIQNFSKLMKINRKLNKKLLKIKMKTNK